MKLTLLKEKQNRILSFCLLGVGIFLSLFFSMGTVEAANISDVDVRNKGRDYSTIKYPAIRAHSANANFLNGNGNWVGRKSSIKENKKI
ncbi:MAG: hypothetical protein EOM50_02940 [Erysipelotrichia bacterium]|nr:hypothetical protein [Erysipelotrichia bacterium]NCC55773.1 hypothetical protein [Erysipelotrichia bacterium]